MNLGSFSFLILFLPLALAVYYCAPARFRQPVLLGVSAGFYCLSDPGSFWLFAALVAADCALLWAMGRARGKTRSILYYSIVAKSAAAVAVFFALAQLRGGAAPLGLAVEAFSAVWCAASLSRGNIPDEAGSRFFALYAAFFPRLLAGPLMPFEDFVSEIRAVKFSPGRLLDGFGQLVQGAFKLLVFGANLNALYLAIGAIPEEQTSVLGEWCRMLALALALYYSVSGVTDMAAGVSGMFGIKLPQNFYYPYQSRSAEDFMDRFNGTVTNFLKTVFLERIPKKYGAPARAAGLLAAGALWGMWFGLRPGYLAWGALLAFAVFLERSALKSFAERFPPLFRRAFAFALVMLLFPVFDGETTGVIAATYSAMFRLDLELPLINERIRYLLVSNWLLLALSVLLATSLADLAVRKLLRAAPRVSRAAFTALSLAVLTVMLSFTLQGAESNGSDSELAEGVSAFAAGLERRALGWIPERQRLRELNLELTLLGGQRELRTCGDGFSGVFIGERGLMKNIEPPDASAVSRNTAALQNFSRQAAEMQITSVVMLIPTAGAILQDDLPPYAQSVMVNQLEVIEEVYSRLVAPTVTVNAYSALINRRDQYIYYRTDDSLTALGGFYVGQLLALRLGLDDPRLNQYEIDYSDTAYFGDLYAITPYANITADTVSQFRLKQAASAPQQYLVTRRGGGRTVVYHTMFPSHAPQIGKPLDIFFGGAATIIDVRTSLSSAPSVIVFGDKTAFAWLPFLCDLSGRVTLVDLSARPEELKSISLDDYDVALFGYGVESFIHTDIPSRALQFLEDGQ